MTQTSGLTIRQHERESLQLRVEFVISQEFREQLRYSPTSSAPDAHGTSGIASDISPGGMGLICRQFVPRMSEGVVRVYSAKPIGSGPDGTPIHKVIFEHAAKVRRVSMHSPQPDYAIGLAFLDPDPNIKEKVARVLDDVVDHADRSSADEVAGSNSGGGRDA